jgi:hypothetical protein
MPSARYLQVILLSRETTQSIGVILYAELMESEYIEAAKDPRTLGKTIINCSGIDRCFPSGVWPTENFGVDMVQRRFKSIISKRYLVETLDGRKVWIWKD